MQNASVRALVLAAVLGVGILLLAATANPGSVAVARWPIEDSVYAVADWRVSPVMTEALHGAQLVSRTYTRSDGVTANLLVSTSPVAKSIYRAGADVPFLGNGYTVDPAPPSLVPGDSGRTAMIVRRGSEVSLLVYAYGERRGLLGNGPVAWGFVVLDSVRGHANDYYLARMLVPLAGPHGQVEPDGLELAGTVFGRLAAWYRA